MDKCGESGYVSRVEDNYNVLDIRTILLDEVTKFRCDLAVSLEQVLTCHTVLARSTT